MRRHEVALLLGGFLVVAGALLALGYAVSPDYARRNFAIFTEMAHSAAYQTQSPNPNFADGMTQRVPPAGTIARGYLPLALDPDDTGRAAAAALRNPVSDTDPTVRERGAALFQQDCLPCHGAGGEGNGPVALKGYPPPPSLLAANARGLADGAIFHIITYGRGNMPGLAIQVEPDDRWKVVRHIRSLQGIAAPATAAPGTGGRQ